MRQNFSTVTGSRGGFSPFFARYAAITNVITVVIATAAHMIPTVAAIFFAAMQIAGDRHAENIHDGNGNQEMPAEFHELVKSVARESESQPQENVQINSNFEQEPECAVNSGLHCGKNCAGR